MAEAILVSSPQNDGEILLSTPEALGFVRHPHPLGSE